MEDKSKHIICSVSVAAFNLGITVQGLNQWIKKNNFKKDGRNVDFTEILFLRREQALGNYALGMSCARFIGYREEAESRSKIQR